MLERPARALHEARCKRGRARKRAGGQGADRVRPPAPSGRMAPHARASCCDQEPTRFALSAFGLHASDAATTEQGRPAGERHLAERLRAYLSTHNPTHTFSLSGATPSPFAAGRRRWTSCCSAFRPRASYEASSRASPSVRMAISPPRSVIRCTGPSSTRPTALGFYRKPTARVRSENRSTAPAPPPAPR